MHRRLAFTLATGVAAATLALTGCGAEQSGGTPSAQESAAVQPSSQSSPATTPGPATAPSTATGPGEKAGDGEKPSKQEIVAGLSTFYRQTQGLSADKAEKFAVCMVDEMYDKAKTATLEAMRDGDTTKIATSDAGLVAEAGFSCQSVLK